MTFSLSPTMRKPKYKGRAGEADFIMEKTLMRHDSTEDSSTIDTTFTGVLHDKAIMDAMKTHLNTVHNIVYLQIPNAEWCTLLTLLFLKLISYFVFRPLGSYTNLISQPVKEDGCLQIVRTECVGWCDFSVIVESRSC